MEHAERQLARHQATGINSPIRIQSRNMVIHVLVPVVVTDDRVQFEQDAVRLAPARDSMQLCNVFASAATDLRVGLFVEAVA